MDRQVLYDCSPFVAGIVGMLACLALLLRLSGARFRLPRLKKFHADEVGGVQSLSFVMTIPLFIMIMMFIVQLTQVTIARIVIEYAAFAAARSAVVWVPANLGPGDGEEEENRVGSGRIWINEVQAEDGRWYDIYQLDTSFNSASAKAQRIRLAAAMACLSISPSRAVAGGGTQLGDSAAAALTRAFNAIAPSRSNNTRVPVRLRNKLSYALRNTDVEIYVHHRRDQPYLGEHFVLRDYREFTESEIGFQDQMHVRVRHRFALLPGPGRLLATFVSRPDRDDPDTVAQRITLSDQGVYTMELTATARVQNEGEKSFWPHFEDPFGRRGPVIVTAIEAENYPEIPPRPMGTGTPPVPDPYWIPPTLPPLDDSGIIRRPPTRSVDDLPEAREDPDCCDDSEAASKKQEGLKIQIE